MYKTAVIGDSESVSGFMALGFSVYKIEYSSDPHKCASDAAKAVKQAADDDCAVIFIVETLAQQISDTLDRYKDKPLPAIIPIPGRSGATGYGMNVIRRSVERAVGADIL